MIAAETLANHIRCNNSFVQAVFQAQFRSSLSCPRCHKQSNTFDPFHCISVQLPQLVQQVVFVTVSGQMLECQIGKLKFLRFTVSGSVCQSTSASSKIRSRCTTRITNSSHTRTTTSGHGYSTRTYRVSRNH